jgi:kumamolisin
MPRFRPAPPLSIWIAISIIVALAPFARADTTTLLPDSITSVEPLPSSGIPDPRTPTVVRETLRADELAAPIDFDVALKMRHVDELKSRIERRENISFDDMANKYQPKVSDYQTVAHWLTSQGFQLTVQDPSHLCVFARGTAAQVQQALKLKLARVALKGSEYTSAITAPNVPASFAPLLVGINGLQPQNHMRKLGVFRIDDIGTTGAPYTPQQIAQAYGATALYNQGITGAGETTAIVIDAFPLTSDLTKYWSTYSISQSMSNITEIKVNGNPGSISSEETLDTEWSSSIAPGSKIRIYGTPDLSAANVEAAYARIYSDLEGKISINQMTMSYGIGETYPTKNGYHLSPSQATSDNNYFMEIAVANVSIFASSGDGGATPGPDGAGDESDPNLQVQWPASCAYITGVGGTSLNISDVAGDESSESVWNDSSGAGGGGTSTVTARPSWQTGSTVPGGSYRLVPDLSCAADLATGGALYYNGEYYIAGGTSWSSPTVAGFCALMNQALGKVGKGPVGMLASKIYPLIGTANFRDITTGSNATDNSNGLYPAGVGYDEASGVGVPLVSTLTQTLMGPVFTSPPASQVATTGQPVTFSVGVTGTGPLSYQWSKDGSAISGATGATYTIASPTGASTGNYSVAVTDEYSTNTSSTADLVVATSAPVAQQVSENAPVTFSIVEANTSLTYTYQWYYDGVAISGANSSSYTIRNAPLTASGSYSVMVTDSYGNVTTTPVYLAVAMETDTPTMPRWTLLILAAMLVLTAAPGWRQNRRA